MAYSSRQIPRARKAAPKTKSAPVTQLEHKTFFQFIYGLLLNLYKDGKHCFPSGKGRRSSQSAPISL